MGSTNFSSCLDVIKSNETLWRAGGTDLSGNLVNDAANVAGITYRMCASHCGTSPVAFDFSSFSTQFSSFMLPFLALTAQLPFGASNHADNFSTIALTIGSPTLALFSLVITVLNSRWLKRRFRRTAFPNTSHAVTTLNNLQQSLLSVVKDYDGHPLLASLVVLPQNDQWWQRASASLSFTHTWSMANMASVAWAAVAYLLTITSMDPSSMAVDGPAIACAWMWLLPLVVGWLQISPNCDELALQAKMVALNAEVYVSSATSPPGAAPILATDVTDGCALAVWAPRPSNTSKQQDFDSDESRSPPIFNYARTFAWARAAEEVALAFDSAAWHASQRIPVAGAPSVWRINDQLEKGIHPENRTGDAAAVAAYVEAATAKANYWAPEVWQRVIYATLVSCAVQWISTGSAVLAAWMTPTVGLGCQSGSFLMYGTFSTIAFLLIILGEYCRQLSHRSFPRFSTLSVVLRRSGKILAWANGLVFILLDVLAFANVLYDCYCGANVIGRGRDNGYMIMFYDPSAMHFVRWWIGSVVLATISALVFGFSIFILIK